MRERSPREPQEPVGIVISSGARDDVTPKFAAFEWSPAPDDTQIVSQARAA